RLAACLFPKQLDMRKRVGVFKRLEHFDFGILVSGSYKKMDGNHAFFELWLNAHYVHSGGQGFFQVHEHLGPIDTAGLQNTDGEFRVLLKARGILLGEISFEVAALRFDGAEFLFDFIAASAEIIRRLAQAIKVPAQAEEKNQCNRADHRRAGKEAAVADKGPGGEI